MHLFFKIKEVRVDLLPQNPENGHFSTKNGQKMAFNGQNCHFFYMDPVQLCTVVYYANLNPKRSNFCREITYFVPVKTTRRVL